MILQELRLFALDTATLGTPHTRPTPAIASQPVKVTVFEASALSLQRTSHISSSTGANSAQPEKTTQQQQLNWTETTG